MPVTIDEARHRHIFRYAEGHFREDTPANRKILIDVASEPQNFLGSDRLGNRWFEETLADGRQVWAQVRDNKVTNGGINERPRRLAAGQLGNTA